MASEILAQSKSHKDDSCLKMLWGSQKNGFRNPCSMQEVKKMTPASSCSREVRKMASEILVQRKKSEKRLLPQAPQGKVRKMALENPAQRRKMIGGGVLGEKSQENDFRKPRPTQEVRKMTPASDDRRRCARGEVRKMTSKNSAQRRSQENDSCLKMIGGGVLGEKSQGNDFRKSRSRKMTHASSRLGEVRKMASASNRFGGSQENGSASNRLGGSQENGFRNLRSTQEVRKRTILDRFSFEKDPKGTPRVRYLIQRAMKTYSFEDGIPKYNAYVLYKIYWSESELMVIHGKLSGQPPIREGLLEELVDRSIARKDDRPHTNVIETDFVNISIFTPLNIVNVIPID
ncbi:hypothetical protein V8G54_025049 [Vigna mungo]|uniref:Uncharacterized protein n=1 Tax=Vigna mungo TaxID=3915 RepID=A0AAQ3N8R2_VIGMU